MEKSNNSTFVIFIFEILKHRPFNIWLFQMLTSTLKFILVVKDIKKSCKFLFLVNFILFLSFAIN